jgi:hypothetical protein
MIDLLASATEDRRDEGFKFLLSKGDLRQMSAQKSFLCSQGFAVGQVNVYPALRTEQEYIDALRKIWEFRVHGWWNYECDLLKHHICTKAEYDRELGRG